MTPGARIQAAIEILDAITRAETPADRLLSGWFRRRRYVGSKDRRAIIDRVYGVLRRRAALGWWLARAGYTANPDGRARVIAALAFEDDLVAFDGSTYGPDPLTAAETAFAAALTGQALDHAEQPPDVRGNYPGWLGDMLAAVFGERLAKEMSAYNAEAPVDLRVNALKGGRAAAQAALAAEDVDASPTPLSPLGLRLAGRVPLDRLDAYKTGLVEVQDEASQIAAFLVDARPGQNICDFCAGAGGKTLAIAGAMNNQGHILACDADATRLRPMAARLERSGVNIVEARVTGADNDAAGPEAGFDRVLVDAPCTGSGAWRRNPDARWRLTPEDVTHWCEVQDTVLAAAAPLVRAGGRLVYVTCSILAEENEVRIDAFLAAHGGFAVVPVSQVWAETVGGDCPCDDPYLFLTPARHGTDGFFAAVLERQS